MNVFILDAEVIAAVFDFAEDRVQTGFDCGAICFANNLLTSEHARVGDRAADILACEATVERQRGIQPVDQFIRRLAESSSPQLRSWSALLVRHVSPCHLQDPLFSTLRAPV